MYGVSMCIICLVACDSDCWCICASLPVFALAAKVSSPALAKIEEDEKEVKSLNIRGPRQRFRVSACVK